ncbi:hypothetical protein LOC68_02575 [Blastopirellula sp. JC732]|uniref:Carboxypeptidase regulatory-like domain-containing protein n=1 Tax=Blastopirellula sediminis TaxID=2894196 RepID=A0A9X1SEJ5_9BACT|nr:hypothetical protein [Blastopirellula sediminis]MCC9607939.1 hypothetical protein [Blastopirellula sediminis]MCC9627268.1 hypothetical protein [Blastopirellula sediminis]
MYRNQLRSRSAPTLTFSLAALAIACLTGCGGEASRNPGVEVYPTKVKVTYKGGPIEGALVSLNSTEAQRSASGVTDAEGFAVLTTFDYGDGAIPGAHEVKISKDVMETVREANPDDPMSAAVVRPKHLLPQRYGAFKTSGLTASVTPGENQLDFELKD